MAQDCPLCFSKGVFDQWNNLKDSLVSLSTRNFTCPLCYGVHEGSDATILIKQIATFLFQYVHAWMYVHQKI